MTYEDIVIKVGEYLNSDDPVLKDCEIVLQDFVHVLDHVKDEVLYVKIIDSKVHIHKHNYNNYNNIL
ncbi:hypothetical protein ig2599ANME_0622 [groundwater metagenome]